MNKITILLISIFCLALFLRFYNLGTNPPSLTWDEAAWGYNAYTLGATGHDEFGKFLPTTYLESFGDFKPPVYAYLSILPIKLFGLNEFSTRFASAFFGSLTVLVAYFLVLEIFPTSKNKKVLAMGSSFLLAVSPWHILLSRAAFEANVATFFIAIGIFLFFYSIRKRINVWIFMLSLISFVLAVNTFNTARVFLPLFVVTLFILKRDALLKNWKRALLGIFPALLLSLPLLFFLMTPQAKLRYLEVNIFSNVDIVKRANQEIQNDNNSQFSKIIHNRRLAYGVEYVKHYLDNVDPGFLFIHGDGNPKFSIQDVGQMYIWELPVIIIGTLLLFRKKEGNWMVLPLWFILGIIPAATARETPHALRIETVLPVPQMLVAYGLFYSYEYISKIKVQILHMQIKYAIFTLSILFFIFYFSYFLHTYFVHYPVRFAQEWQYGYKEAVTFAESQKENYKNIYMTEDLGRPYIYVLFYGSYPPSSLDSAKVSRESLGFVHVNKLGKYIFANEFPKEEKTLYISTPRKTPTSARIIKKFLLPNGEIALIAYE